MPGPAPGSLVLAWHLLASLLEAARVHLCPCSLTWDARGHGRRRVVSPHLRGGGARRGRRWPDGWDECRDTVTCPWRVITLGAAVEAVIPRKGGTRSTVWQVYRCVKLLVSDRETQVESELSC